MSDPDRPCPRPRGRHIERPRRGPRRRGRRRFPRGLFGVGGGVLIVPGLVIAAGMDQRLAHGTSLAAVVPISVASLLTYAAHDNVDWTAALWLSIGAVAGAVIGTRLLHVLPHRTLALVPAVVLITSAVRLFIATDADGRAPLSATGAVALVAVGLGDRHPRRSARRRRRHRRRPGDDPALRHAAGDRQGHVGGSDRPDRVDGHLAQPDEGQRRPAGGGDRRRRRHRHRRARRHPLGQDERRALQCPVRDPPRRRSGAAAVAAAAANDDAAPHGQRRQVSSALLSLRRASGAPVTAEIRDVDDRLVVWRRVRRDDILGLRWCPLSSTASSIVGHATCTARDQGLPLVVVMASTGADIVEGIAALEGWGQLAKGLVLLGDRADDPRRGRAGGIRTGAAARRRRPRGDDRGQLRLRQRPGDGRGVHRGSA